MITWEESFENKPNRSEKMINTNFIQTRKEKIDWMKERLLRELEEKLIITTIDDIVEYSFHYENKTYSLFIKESFYDWVFRVDNIPISEKIFFFWEEQKINSLSFLFR